MNIPIIKSCDLGHDSVKYTSLTCPVCKTLQQARTVLEEVDRQRGVISRLQQKLEASTRREFETDKAMAEKDLKLSELRQRLEIDAERIETYRQELGL